MIKQTSVKSLSNLKTAIAQSKGYKEYIVTLDSDISITENITIPENIILDFSRYAFFNKANYSIVLNATLRFDIRQLFYNFLPGQITGTFGGIDRHPEWWGLEAEKNEKAINCAIRARNPLNSGHKIILQAKSYEVSGPIDLSGSNCLLEGKGPSRTIIMTSKNWTADWKTDSLYGVNSHGAVIWLGSAVRDTIQSMNTGVNNLMINCYYASLNNLDKRISGISSYGWMEEHTAISNVTISYFSGYGIGMCSNGNPPQIINGLSIRNFWITNPVSGSALPIALGRHTTCATISSGTLDCGVMAGSMFAGKPWPLIHTALWVEGARAVISDIHIESVKIGILIRDYGQINSVNINGVDCRMGWEEGMKDAFVEPVPSYGQQLPANTDFWKHSTLLAIYGEPAYTPTGILEGHTGNVRSRVVATNLVASDRVRYLVRDPAMGQDILNWNNGQSSTSFGSLTSYIRSNAWSPKYNCWYYNAPGAAIGKFPQDGKTYLSIVE